MLQRPLLVSQCVPVCPSVAQFFQDPPLLLRTRKPSCKYLAGWICLCHPPTLITPTVLRVSTHFFSPKQYPGVNLKNCRNFSTPGWNSSVSFLPPSCRGCWGGPFQRSPEFSNISWCSSSSIHLFSSKAANHSEGSDHVWSGLLMIFMGQILAEYYLDKCWAKTRLINIGKWVERVFTKKGLASQEFYIRIGTENFFKPATFTIA